MSETPETDSVDAGIFYCIPMTDHARRLERERDHLRASLEQQANQVMAKASQVAAGAIRQRDELAAALRELHQRYVSAIGNEGPEAMRASNLLARIDAEKRS